MLCRLFHGIILFPGLFKTEHLDLDFDTSDLSDSLSFNFNVDDDASDEDMSLSDRLKEGSNVNGNVNGEEARARKTISKGTKGKDKVIKEVPVTGMSCDKAEHCELVHVESNCRVFISKDVNGSNTVFDGDARGLHGTNKTVHKSLTNNASGRMTASERAISQRATCKRTTSKQASSRRNISERMTHQRTTVKRKATKKTTIKRTITKQASKINAAAVNATTNNAFAQSAAAANMTAQMTMNHFPLAHEPIARESSHRKRKRTIKDSTVKKIMATKTNSAFSPSLPTSGILVPSDVNVADKQTKAPNTTPLGSVNLLKRRMNESFFKLKAQFLHKNIDGAIKNKTRNFTRMYGLVCYQCQDVFPEALLLENHKCPAATEQESV